MPLGSYHSLISSLLSTATKEDFRLNKRDFSRSGPLSPDLLITLLLYMVADANRRGYRHLIDAFWDEAGSYGLALPREQAVSSAALCKARRKISPDLVLALLHQAADTFDAQFGSNLRWNGRRVFAVDGSKVNVQRGQNLSDEFGVPSGAHCPQVLVSTLFDLVAKVPHDITVSPYASCERQEMVKHLDRLNPGDVLVLDRGYPSFEVLRMLTDAGIDFVIRVPIRQFAGVEHLIHGESDDCLIRIDPPKNGPMSGSNAVDVRALRVEVPGSEPTVLLTSLVEPSFTHSALAELYHMRWEVENFYKLVKSDYLGQGQFHARSAQGVEQEIYAVALFVGITRFLMAAAAETHDDGYHTISPKCATLAFADYVTRLLLACDAEEAAPFLERLLQRMIKTKDPPRPLRKFIRRSFKPISKWCPGGRRGG